MPFVQVSRNIVVSPRGGRAPIELNYGVSKASIEADCMLAHDCDRLLVALRTLHRVVLDTHTIELSTELKLKPVYVKITWKDL
jgi:hypothetical protein